MGDEIRPRLGVVGEIRLHGFAASQDSVLHHPSTGHGVPIECIGPAQNGKVRQADLVGVPVDDGGHAEETGVDRAVADLQLKVAAIIELRPLEFTVCCYEIVTLVVGSFDGNVVAIRTWACDGCPSKLHPNTSFPGFCVVGMLTKPDKITNPIGM